MQKESIGYPTHVVHTYGHHPTVVRHAGHGHYVAHHDDDWGWSLWIGVCFFFFVLFLLPLALLSTPHHKYHHKHHYGPCDDGYGDYYEDGQMFSMQAPRAHTHKGSPVSVDPATGAYVCAVGDELWSPPGTYEGVRCVPEFRAPNGSHPDMADTNTAPCDNFYKYASGQWLEQAPHDFGRFFGYAAQKNADLVRDIDTVEIARTWDHSPQGAFLASCVAAYTTSDPEGDAKAREYIAGAMEQLDVAVSGDSFDLGLAIGIWTRRGFASPLHIEPVRSPVVPNTFVMYVEPAGAITTGNTDSLRTSVVSELLETNDEERIDNVINIENAIKNAIRAANVQETISEQDYLTYMRTPAGYEAHTTEDISTVSALNWDNLYAEIMGRDGRVARSTVHWLHRPKYVRRLTDLQGQFTANAWKDYFEFTMRYHMFEFMPGTYGVAVQHADRDAPGAERSLQAHLGITDNMMFPWSVRRQHWHKVRYEFTEQSKSVLAMHLTPHDMPRLVNRDRCVRQRNLYMPAETDAAFTDAALSPEARARITSVVNDVIRERKQMIVKSKHVSATGKQALAAKLDAIKIRVGTAPRHKSVQVSAKNPHWENVLKIKQSAVVARFNQLLRDAESQRVETPYLMPTSAVNAYYNPQDNTVSILTGITAYPFFSPDYDDATLYATLGMVVGHEIGHSTDAQGLNFDAAGAVRDWLPEQDVAAFSESNACFVNQYTDRTPEGHEIASGRRTVTEDAADNVGLRAALNALKRTKPSDDDLRTFFLQFAQMWAVRQSADHEHSQISFDPHAIAQFRVNKALQNCPEFLEMYGCNAQPVCELAA